MNAYRTPAPQEKTSSPLTYDYAKALEKGRSGVVFDSVRFTLGIAAVVGFYPFVALCGQVGWLIGIASFAFVGVPLAIRRAQQTTAEEIEAYETQLLSKARKRSRRKRR